MRCKACNSIMQDYENLSKNPRTGEHEELCRGCINLSNPFTFEPGISCIPTPLLDILPRGPGSYEN